MHESDVRVTAVHLGFQIMFLHGGLWKFKFTPVHLTARAPQFQSATEH